VPFVPKTWQNGVAGGTELDADAIIDMETRLSDYTDLTRQIITDSGVPPADVATLPDGIEWVQVQ